jgi:hypothetical protein
MAARADWLVSSRTWTSQTIKIDGDSQVIDAPLGGLYLLHVVADLSLIHQLYLGMVAAGVSSPAVTITKDRRVKLTSSGTFTLDWDTGTTLRNLLGFAANLSGASSYVAPARSTLLWSAGKTLSPTLSPLDAGGAPTMDAFATVGPQGNQVVREEGAPTYIESYEVLRLPKSRYYAAPPTPVPGDWWHFWLNERGTNQRCMVLRKVLESESTDTSDAEYSTSYVVGPFVHDMTGRDAMRLIMNRSIRTVEKYYDVEIPVIKTQEFGA